jgi:hypothetical protein
VSATKETKIARKGVLVALGIICVVLVAGLIATIAFYTFEISSLQKQVNDLQNTTDYYPYHDEFGSVSLLSPGINFSPPVSMYRALTIALESDRWNASSLNNMEVRESLEYWEFSINSSSSGERRLHSVTQPAEDYSPVQVNGTTYRYIWDISVEPKVGWKSIPPLGLYWVDAATGEILSRGLIL